MGSIDYPNLSFHIHQILSALQDISNHLAYLPDVHRDVITGSLHQLNHDLSELVADVDTHSGTPTLKNEYAASDKSVNVAPFERSETIAVFDHYIALNADGVFTYANPITFTIFGQPDHDLTGSKIWDAFPDLINSPLYSTFQAAVSSRLPVHIEMQGAKDRWFAISIHPTHNGVILYWSDITARKEIEQALRDTEERFRLALETAPINVFALDRNLRYVWVGPRRDVFFHEPTVGKRDDEMLPAQDAAILMEAEQYVVDTGKGLRKEVRFTKNDQPLIYSMVLEPLFDRNHHVVGLTIAVMDVTEQRRLEAEKQAAAAKVELQRQLIERSELERVSLAQDLHDGPIQSLVGLGFSLQLLKETLTADRTNGGDPMQQMGQEIKDVVAEIRNICSALRPPALSHIGLRQAIEENCAEIRAKHVATEITLEFPDDPIELPEPTVLALFRIYQHALNNVFRHAQANRVWIRLKQAPDQILFEIQDDGRGFPEAFNSIAYAREGHLGVVGMQERAEAIGGAFQLLSQPGSGTTILVTIPLNRVI